MWQFWVSPSRLPQVRKKTGWVQGLVSWMALEMAATSGRIIALTWDQSSEGEGSTGTAATYSRSKYQNLVFGTDLE